LNYNIAERQEKEMERMHSLDRVIVLKPKEGQTPLSGTGTPDKRLFTGENKLHAVYNNTFGLWEMKYDSGALPGGLDGKFTDFDKLLEHVRMYFGKRNIEIVEVKD
jgi:hypothetical protein